SPRPSMLLSVIQRPPLPTPVPYTTLFRSHLPRTGNLARRAAVPARRGGPSEAGFPAAATVLGSKPWKNKLRAKYRRKEEICMQKDRKSTRLNSSHVKI